MTVVRNDKEPVIARNGAI